MYERLAEVAGISRIETQSDNYDNKMHWSVIKVIVFIVTKEEQKIDLIEWENKLMGIWVEWWRNVLTFYVFYAASIVENSAENILIHSVQRLFRYRLPPSCIHAS